MMNYNHDQLELSPSGIVISVAHPYLGALPDGIVSCNCCKLGLCEVKVNSVIVHNFVLIILSVHSVTRITTWQVQHMMHTKNYCG